MYPRKHIFAFVGPSGCGKTTVLKRLLDEHGNQLGYVKTVTTRERRPDDTDDFYTFVSVDEFCKLDVSGRLLQNGDVYYAENWYDNDRAEVDAIFTDGKHGVCALLERSIETFRKAGYTVVVIRLKPVGDIDQRSSERRRADEKREREAAPPDTVIVNDFTKPDGLDRAVARAKEFIGSYICGGLRTARQAPAQGGARRGMSPL